jgi:peptide/nickel transport system permease protein
LTSYIFRRLAAILSTLLVLTILIYGVAMVFPIETRAELYFPKNPGKNFKESSRPILIARIIKDYRLDDPFPVQYTRWLGGFVTGNWGYSPSNSDDVLPALIRLAPGTAELTLYSLILFIPLGLIGGIYAGGHRRQKEDRLFRLAAFIATSLPPMVLAILLLAVFYVMVHWFPPDRLSDTTRLLVIGSNFHLYTGLYTIDGLLNGRPDITLEALRHLASPVITLSLFHWATLGRVTRASIMEEMDKEYILSGRARGISDRVIVWKHAFRNALLPALNSTALSAASLITGVYVVEAIFNFRGVSYFIRNALSNHLVDLPAMMGFTIFSVSLVLVFMAILDLLQAIADPRYREGLMSR